LPLEVAMSAALPVEASGELASMVSETTLPDTLPLTVRSAGNEVLADVGLPPHPVIADAMVASDRV
jgi:hypothetical protein